MEKCRAAWAVIRCSGRISGVVFSGLVQGGPHSVPRAELMAAVATLAAARQFRLHSDCSYVVRGFQNLKVVCRPGKPNSDLWRIVEFALQIGWEPDIMKVKAHLSVETASSDQELFEIVGNDLADNEAKRVVLAAVPNRPNADELPEVSSLTLLLNFFAACQRHLASKIGDVGRKPLGPDRAWGDDFSITFRIQLDLLLPGCRVCIRSVASFLLLGLCLGSRACVGWDLRSPTSTACLLRSLRFLSS